VGVMKPDRRFVSRKRADCWFCSIEPSTPRRGTRPSIAANASGRYRLFVDWTVERLAHVQRRARSQALPVTSISWCCGRLVRI